MYHYSTGQHEILQLETAALHTCIEGLGTGWLPCFGGWAVGPV